MEPPKDLREIPEEGRQKLSDLPKVGQRDADSS
jgi:hypothetical protein